MTSKWAVTHGSLPPDHCFISFEDMEGDARAEAEAVFASLDPSLMTGTLQGSVISVSLEGISGQKILLTAFLSKNHPAVPPFVRITQSTDSNFIPMRKQLGLESTLRTLCTDYCAEGMLGGLGTVILSLKEYLETPEAPLTPQTKKAPPPPPSTVSPLIPPQTSPQLSYDVARLQALVVHLLRKISNSSEDGDKMVQHVVHDIEGILDTDCPALDETAFATNFSREIVRFGNHPDFSALWTPQSRTGGGSLVHRIATRESSRFHTEFTMLTKLGEGQFGSVCAARNNLDNNTYAVKRILLPLRETEQSQKEVLREVTLLANLNHQNLVRYYHAWVEDVPLSEYTNLPGDDDEEEDKDSSDEEVENGEDEPEAVQFGQVKTPYPPAKADPSDDSSSSDEYGQESWMRGPPVYSHQQTAEDSNTEDESGSSEVGQESWVRGSSPVSKSSPKAPPPRSDSRRVLFIQMEHCNAETLRSAIEAHALKSEKHILSVFRQLLHCVEYLHARKIIHRDLKPDNIFFSASSHDFDGDIKIGDFGLARRLGTANSAHDILMLGLSNKGTEVYMAPEQKASMYNELVDEYAIGIILIEMYLSFEKFDFRQRRDVLNRIALGKSSAEAITSIFRGKYPTLIELVGVLLCPAKNRMSAAAILGGDLLAPEVEDQDLIMEKIRRNTDHFRLPLLTHFIEEASMDLCAAPPEAVQGNNVSVLERLCTTICLIRCFENIIVPTHFALDQRWTTLWTYANSHCGAAKRREPLVVGNKYLSSRGAGIFVPALPAISWCKILASSSSVQGSGSKRFSVQPWRNAQGEEDVCFSLDVARAGKDHMLLLTAEVCHVMFNLFSMLQDRICSRGHIFFIRLNHASLANIAASGKLDKVFLDHMRASSNFEEIFAEVQQRFKSAPTYLEKVSGAVDEMRTFLKLLSYFTPFATSRTSKVEVIVDLQFRGVEPLGPLAVDGIHLEFGIKTSSTLISLGGGCRTDGVLKELGDPRVGSHPHPAAFSAYLWLKKLGENLTSTTDSTPQKVEIYSTFGMDSVKERITAAVSCWRRLVPADLRPDGERELQAAKMARSPGSHLLYIVTGGVGEATLYLYHKDKLTRDVKIRIRTPYNLQPIEELVVPDLCPEWKFLKCMAELVPATKESRSERDEEGGQRGGGLQASRRVRRQEKLGKHKSSKHNE